jgi:hypothetical protein
VETLFLRVVNATRHSKGHKEETEFLSHFVGNLERPGSLGQNMEHQRKGGNGGVFWEWQLFWRCGALPFQNSQNGAIARKYLTAYLRFPRFSLFQRFSSCDMSRDTQAQHLESFQ